MTPLAVIATVPGAIALPLGRLALDGLLAAAVALRDALPPVSVVGVTDIDIPVAREPRGRFHLASFAQPGYAEHELRYINRRFPLAEAQALGNARLRRVQISTGPCKSFRIPMETGYVDGGELVWWCIGDAEQIAELLGMVTHLGRRRGVGLGRVAQWRVEPCEPWGDDFPVVRDGRALRPLPPDWAGLQDADIGYACLTYPYWRRPDEVLCALPG